VELMGKDTISVDVGQRLRTLREERKVSMRALARRSSLSANALSMIERGLTSPSVTTLNKLANAMEIPITAFFRQDVPRGQVVFRKPHERVHVQLDKGLWEGLGGEAFSGRFEPFILTLESNGSSGTQGMLHTGHEFVFLLRGKLEFEVNGELYHLEPGDDLMFAASLPHRWHNPGPAVTSAIFVLAGFEESERPSEFHFTGYANPLGAFDPGSTGTQAMEQDPT